jgi:hypothetical protein
MNFRKKRELTIWSYWSMVNGEWTPAILNLLLISNFHNSELLTIGH